MGDDISLSEWKDRQANLQIFRMKDRSPESEASRLLELSSTNRVVTDEEAKIMVALTVQSRSLGPAYDWVGSFVAIVEEYQLTVGSPKNSRETFAAVLTSTLHNSERRKASMWDKLLGKFGGGGEED